MLERSIVEDYDPVDGNCLKGALKKTGMTGHGEPRGCDLGLLGGGSSREDEFGGRGGPGGSECGGLGDGRREGEIGGPGGSVNEEDCAGNKVSGKPGVSCDGEGDGGKRESPLAMKQVFENVRDEEEMKGIVMLEDTEEAAIGADALMMSEMEGSKQVLIEADVTEVTTRMDTAEGLADGMDMKMAAPSETEMLVDMVMMTLALTKKITRAITISSFLAYREEMRTTAEKEMKNVNSTGFRQDQVFVKYTEHMVGKSPNLQSLWEGPGPPWEIYLYPFSW